LFISLFICYYFIYIFIYLYFIIYSIIFIYYLYFPGRAGGGWSNQRGRAFRIVYRFSFQAGDSFSQFIAFATVLWHATDFKRSYIEIILICV
jgi:hypothetical protein